MYILRALVFPAILLLGGWQFCFAADGSTQRTLVKAAMAARPGDPWPRGVGHVVYAWPGSVETEKGYEEPGGSFSPAVGSFGLSFWVVDGVGNLLCTSDSIAPDKISQHFQWIRGRALPDIVVETPYYTATWSLTAPERYVLRLHSNNGVRVLTAIRSVGPAGGPITSLTASKHRLVIDNNWTVRFSSGTRVRAIGHEGDSAWITQANAAKQWHGDDGWGYALLGSAQGIDLVLALEEKNLEKPSLRFRDVAPAFSIDLPDARFSASLSAQVAHLMMGLVNNETRPGEPTNYPLPWLRDGAYVVVALARAGQIDVAKQLARYFADHDFFGGFGPEADAPGLSLWALGEVSEIAHDSAFDAAVWPSVQRKVEFIQRMRRTASPIYQEPFGPIVPVHAKAADLNLVAEPARDGLIVGRMDWGRPLLFVNAVSFAGILQAAGVAERMGQPQKANEWRDEAASIQQAWERALPTKENENERTYISALWPTAVGAGSIESFTPLLERRWESLHTNLAAYLHMPEWTYFDIADAHQWLLLGREDRAWQTLGWFLDHQSAPGLYTWWEGTGEENNFGRWQQVRGWTNPTSVTPHYWTAAELLLLELDMLAHVDLPHASTIVIGGGVPPEWLKSNIDVRGLQTELGTVDWSWHGGKLSAVVRGGHPTVLAGSAFGPAANLTVTYAQR